jgi:hypothetical protein
VLLYTMATITGAWEWRIGGEGEDRRHVNTPGVGSLSAFFYFSHCDFRVVRGPPTACAQLTQERAGNHTHGKWG